MGSQPLEVVVSRFMHDFHETMQQVVKIRRTAMCLRVTDKTMEGLRLLVQEIRPNFGLTIELDGQLSRCDQRNDMIRAVRVRVVKLYARPHILGQEMPGEAVFPIATGRLI